MKRFSPAPKAAYWASAVNLYAPYALFLATLLIAAAMEWVGRHRERSANSEHD